MLSLLFFLFTTAFAQSPPACKSEPATAAYHKGFEAQRDRKTTVALQAYTACLDAEPDCTKCHYEIGWTYWSRSEWDKVKTHWQKVVSLAPNNQEYADRLADLNRRMAQKHGKPTGLHIPMGTTSVKNGIEMQLVARFQNYDHRRTTGGDHHDELVYSPKSARFSADGSKVYVNSLEGYQTVIYDTKTLSRLGSIAHHYDSTTEGLFGDQNTVFGYRYNRRSPTGNPNHFKGKPVESALSHNGRYLWVPYYRRDFDKGATSPSAVSVIDTQTDQIVRVLPTGPIPKFVAISADNRWAAIAHWGDNTLGVIDISSGNPADFTYRDKRLVVERVLAQSGLSGTNRDSTCGYCLRGTLFTPDSKTLLVSRMGGGGLAAFDVATWKYLGTIKGEKPTPRHLVVSKDGQWLFMSSNKSGYVSKAPLSKVVAALRAAGGERVVFDGWQAVYVGIGARTIEITDDGSLLFAAINNSAELVVVDANKMTVLNRIRTDSYAVGLAVSGDGTQVWTTSQGRKGGGGNSVCVYSIRKVVERP
jgi:DNA-binding beta-propeller fold protein YncE